MRKTAPRKRVNINPSSYTPTGIRSSGKEKTVKYFTREVDGSMARVKEPSPQDIASVSVLKRTVIEILGLTPDEAANVIITCIYTGKRGEKLVQVGYNVDVPSHKLSQLRGMVIDVQRRRKVCSGSTYTVAAVATENTMSDLLETGNLVVRPEEGAKEYGGEIKFTQGNYTMRYYNQGTVLNVFLWQGDVFIATHTNINASFPGARYGYGPNYVESLNKMGLVDLRKLFPENALYWPVCYRFMVTTPHVMTASRFTFHQNGYLTYLGLVTVWQWGDEAFTWSKGTEDDGVSVIGLTRQSALQFHSRGLGNGITRVLTEKGSRRYFTDLPSPSVAAEGPFIYNSQITSLSGAQAYQLLRYGFFPLEWHSFIDYESSRYVPREDSDEWITYRAIPMGDRPEWDDYLVSRYEELSDDVRSGMSYGEFFSSANTNEVNPLGRMGEALILIKEDVIQGVFGTVGVRLMPPDYAKRWDIHSEYGSNPYKDFLHNINLHTLDTRGRETEYIREAAGMIKFSLYLPFPHAYDQGGSSVLVPHSQSTYETDDIILRMKYSKICSDVEYEPDLPEKDKELLCEMAAEAYKGRYNPNSNYEELRRELHETLELYYDRLGMSSAPIYSLERVYDDGDDPRTPLRQDLYDAYEKGIADALGVSTQDVSGALCERIWGGDPPEYVAHDLGINGLPERPAKITTGKYTVFDYESLVRNGMTFMPGIYCRALTHDERNAPIHILTKALSDHVAATTRAVSGSYEVSARMSPGGATSVGIYEIVFWYLVMCNPMRQQEVIRCHTRYNADVTNLAKFVASVSFENDLTRFRLSKDVPQKVKEESIKVLESLRRTYLKYVSARRNMEIRSSVRGGELIKSSVGREDIEIARSCVIRVEGKQFLKTVNAVYASKGMMPTINISDPGAKVQIYKNYDRK